LACLDFRAYDKEKVFQIVAEIAFPDDLKSVMY